MVAATSLAVVVFRVLWLLDYWRFKHGPSLEANHFVDRETRNFYIMYFSSSAQISFHAAGIYDFDWGCSHADLLIEILV